MMQEARRIKSGHPRHDSEYTPETLSCQVIGLFKDVPLLAHSDLFGRHCPDKVPINNFLTFLFNERRIATKDPLIYKLT